MVQKETQQDEQVRASISVPKKDWEVLDAYAKSNQASISWVIRRLIRKFVSGETVLSENGEKPNE
ncbi:ribbon-helix-helix domain-containing protein [Deinococcus sp.]|uniref:ribbon-helix-helix domain-containing protein n=1 Tax=Deinococcus sp. TaxID=47478 RepID=UPI003B5C2E87